jgi:UDP-N-acetylmuramoyl-L-alanyl-D-glutamate--2,6-diaminopimelate ligase
MKTIKDLLYGISLERVEGSTSTAVASIAFDSRKVSPNSMFIAIRGVQVDGHDFIDLAIDNGASVIVVEEIPAILKTGIVYVQTHCTREALSMIAANYYGNPSKGMRVVGVTGTNGKTTVATLLYQLFTELGYSCGLLSTVEVKVANKTFIATHTTPDPMQIQSYIAQMRDAGVAFCFMEVSSHGIDQKRVKGIQFDGALFTNLSHDHLDYHKDFASYRDVKKSWFDHLPKSAFAISNNDDKNGAIMLQNTIAKKRFYGLHSLCDYKASVVEMRFDGMLLRVEGKELWTRLTGRFNAYNLLLVYSAAIELGVSEDELLTAMTNLKPAPGRLNWVSGANGVYGVVDFAHTPDALENVLDSINAIRTHNESLITVVGCGGDKDRGKRPKMGAIAARLSSKVIITSDNPRSEDPKLIADAMFEGVSVEHRSKVFIQLDRAEAIRMAVALASPGDVVVVAGKGHENEQIIGDKRIPFSDYEQLSNSLNPR